MVGYGEAWLGTAQGLFVHYDLATSLYMDMAGAGTLSSSTVFSGGGFYVRGDVPIGGW